MSTGRRSPHNVLASPFTEEEAQLSTTEPVKRRRNRGPAVPRNLDKPPLVLTFTEACHELGVSRWTLHRMIKSGELATVKVNDHEGIAYRELLDYVERNTNRVQA
jgi:excisionase family DNA binding protein